MHKKIALVVVLIAAWQACLAAGASAHDALHLDLRVLDRDLHDIFGNQKKPEDPEEKGALLQPTPLAPDEQRGQFRGLDFGSFQAGIGHGLYDFDTKALDATSVHGDVGRRATTLFFTFPIH